MTAFLPVHQLTDDLQHEVPIHDFGNAKCLDAPIFTALFQSRNQIILAAKLGDGSNIEHVSRLHPVSSIIDLLGYDLGRRFEIDLPPPDTRTALAARRAIGRRRRAGLYPYESETHFSLTKSH